MTSDTEFPKPLEVLTVGHQTPPHTQKLECAWQTIFLQLFSHVYGLLVSYGSCNTQKN